MLGAVGVPFPSALSVVVAGSLAAQGQMSLLWAGAVAVAFFCVWEIWPATVWEGCLVESSSSDEGAGSA